MTIWLQISSARGPDECCWVVRHLVRELSSEAARLAVTVTTLETVPNERGRGVRSVLLSLSGHDAARLAKKWQGTIQWTGRSPFRPHHRRRNWFVSVQIFTEPRAEEIDIRDFHLEACRASGPGGQHVNKRDSAVRAVHQPSGLSVRVESERSQHRNRALALAKLAAQLREVTAQRQGEARDDRWTQHNTLERGNAKRIYRGEQFRRVR